MLISDWKFQKVEGIVFNQRHMLFDNATSFIYFYSLRFLLLFHSSDGFVVPLLSLFWSVFWPNPVSEVKVNFFCCSITAIRLLWLIPDTLSSQACPLICVWLLCCNVHQWCAGSQAGRGEDGGCRPWCIVGPGAICIHRYIVVNFPFSFLEKQDDL